MALDGGRQGVHGLPDEIDEHRVFRVCRGIHLIYIDRQFGLDEKQYNQLYYSNQHSMNLREQFLHVLLHPEFLAGLNRIHAVPVLESRDPHGLYRRIGIH